MDCDMHERNATLTITLKADSGYDATQTARVSADQWGRICAIMDEPARAPDGVDGKGER